MTTFSEKLKELRAEKNLTQRELARQLSIPIPTLSHWECGYTEPPHEHLILISQFFNVSIDYLLGRMDELGGVVMPSNSPAVPELTAKEREILQLYNGLNPSGKELVEQTLKTLTAASSTESRKKA